jgi:hypothetical protein
MAEKTLAQKMLVKAGQQIALMNAPAEYEGWLGALQDGGSLTRTPSGAYDAVHLFVYNKADIDAHIAKAVAAVKAGGLVWVAYPKKSGSIKTDITRDHGWDALTALDWHAVTQLSLNETWSVFRVRPRAEIKQFTRKF